MNKQPPTKVMAVVTWVTREITSINIVNYLLYSVQRRNPHSNPVNGAAEGIIHAATHHLTTAQCNVSVVAKAWGKSLRDCCSDFLRVERYHLH